MKKMILYIMLFSGAFKINIFAQIIESNYTRYVNPFIGTKSMGHTFPGATVPFGFVQLSPETSQAPMQINGKYNPEVYKYCAGYQYDDSVIFGFSHTHFSGTGHSDLGDFLIMPITGKLQLETGTQQNPDSGFCSRFSHASETAKPNYYSVMLKDYNIFAEHTTTSRCGLHRYTFGKKEEAHIILDMMHNIYHHKDKNVWTYIRIENDSTISGFRQTNGWARNRTLYFVLQFSKPFISCGCKKYDDFVYKGFWRKFNETSNFPEMAGKNLRLFFSFNMNKNEKLEIKMALSGVSTHGAMQNLIAETSNGNFENICQLGENAWNKELSKIQIETINPEDKTIFYTALYHAFISPNIYMDVDSCYRGLDLNVHKAKNFTNYTVFSLWDTYRALHPLFNILQPERNKDMIFSMLQHYNQSVHHMLPVWSHHANENWCMIGYHAVSVIADAIIKGVVSQDIPKLLQACIITATNPYFDGINYYIKYHYVPDDLNSDAVSKTLEYAYDDWCIAQIASKINDTTNYNKFVQRSVYWQNVFDSSIGFMRPKLSNGYWRAPFNPMVTHGQGFIEGNAWNYGLYVPHQIADLINKMGGNKKFETYLDSLFTMQLHDDEFKHTEDITRDGIIGNYMHGNEPGHHIAYLYNWANAPHKTQKWVRHILKSMYGAGVDGLCGNDDAGQMSAWYIFSALGFYPVCPGADFYAIGSPCLKNAIINLPNGKIFEIKTRNQSEVNIYAQAINLNGKKLTQPFLQHQDIINGGVLEFVMSNKANI